MDINLKWPFLLNSKTQKLLLGDENVLQTEGERSPAAGYESLQASGARQLAASMLLRVWKLKGTPET